MFYSFGFYHLDQIPLKNFLHMDTYKFDDENQAIFCLVDIKVIIKSFNLGNQNSNLQKPWS
jgi:hypothetical protein